MSLDRVLASAAIAAVLTAAVGVHAQDATEADLERAVERFALQPKIVGGKKAEQGEFPFQVAIIRRNVASGSEFLGQFCGGTLVRSGWVLTAAHCTRDRNPQGQVVEKKANQIAIYAGTALLPTGGGPPASARRVNVAEVIRHDQYNLDTYDNDISLLRLEQELPAASFPAVRLPQAADHQVYGAVGMTLTVIGWGDLAEGANAGSPQLMKAPIEVQRRDTCEKNYDAYYGTLPGVGAPVITANMFCVGKPDGDVDSCDGDSGGFIGAPVGDGPPNWIQLGIVSWGEGCARKNLFGVYTKVANYDGWIKQKIGSN